MALEATGRSYEAQDIYKVLRRSKNSSIKGQAKRLDTFFFLLVSWGFGFSLGRRLQSVTQSPAPPKGPEKRIKGAELVLKLVRTKKHPPQQVAKLFLFVWRVLHHEG